MAIAVLIFFIIIPLCLLLCYQCKWFQKCLTRCHLRGRTLDEFVNTFQQYYKDGSNGKWDCRWFSGFYLIIRAAAFLTYALSLNAISFALLTGVCVLAAVVFLMAEPYNEKYSVFNTVSACFLLLQALLFAVMAHRDLVLSVEKRFDVITDLFFAVIVLVPLIDIIEAAIHHLYTKSFYSRVMQNEASLSTSLPDRLVNSDNYLDSFGFIAASQPSSNACSHTIKI